MADKEKDTKLSDEKLRKIFEENTKKIDVGSIDDAQKADIRLMVAGIQEVIDEIEDKKTEFLDKKQTNVEKLEALRKTGKIKVDEEKTKRTEKASELYLSFTENVLKELQADFAFFSDLISSNPPKEVRVFKDSPSDFAMHLNAKIGNTKRSLKKTRKEFRVHFSRYNHDFTMQEKYLDYLANYLKMLELQEKQKAKKKDV